MHSVRVSITSEVYVTPK